MCNLFYITSSISGAEVEGELTCWGVKPPDADTVFTNVYPEIIYSNKPPLIWLQLNVLAK